MLENKSQFLAMIGLLFLEIFRTKSFYTSSVDGMLSFFQSFQKSKDLTPTSFSSLISQVQDPYAKEFLQQIVRELELQTEKDIQTFLQWSPSIVALLTLFRITIIPTKVSETTITQPSIRKQGDIIPFLQLLFLSVFNETLFNELKLYIKFVNIDPKETIKKLREYQVKQDIKFEILGDILPPDVEGTETDVLSTKQNLLAQLIPIVSS
jgi:hypothetical protein